MSSADPQGKIRPQLSTLLGNLPGVVYRCALDRSWTMEFISEGIYDLSGYRPEQLTCGGGVAFSQLIHPDDRDHVWNEIRQATEQAERFEINYRILTADGTKKWVWERGQAIVDEGGEVVAVEGYITDVSEDRKAVESLRKSEERFRLLTKATSDVIWDYDLATDTLWWGEGFSELFGGSLDATLDSWAERLHPDDHDRIVASFDAALEGDALNWKAEYRFRRDDGTYAEVLDRGHIIRNADGAPLRAVGGMTDITERKRLEARVLHNQKIESIGQLAGGLAHDFNNLLSVILCTADIGLANVDQTDVLYEDLVDMRAAAQSAADLTRQLLAFGRRQVLHPAKVDLNRIIDDMLGMLRRLLDETITIDFRPGKALEKLHIDRSQLEQVLVNLVVNARDAMPAGGTITITTEMIEIDEVAADSYGVAKTGPHVLLEVHDTGTGMDEATRERIFDPFFTTKEVGEGTGLGLATVHGIIEQSGGSIWVESTPGDGATFSICFPPSDLPTLDDIIPHTVGEEAGGDETILVVEDDSAVRRLTARVLRSAGYTVLLAEHGKAAVTVVDEQADEIDLVLTDVIMPHMGGPGLAEHIALNHPQIRVVYMTGYAGDTADRLPAGGSEPHLLHKPVSAETLTRTVRDVLDN